MFPTAGAFIFWFAWPIIVIQQTQAIWKVLNGTSMPEDTVKKLRSDLTAIGKQNRKRKQ